jgi:hypothetical protein
MKHLFIVFLFVIISLNACSQVNEEYPFYKNSFSLEFNNPVNYILDGLKFHTKSIPAISLAAEVRINNKLYAEFGLLPFGEDPDGSIMPGTENYGKKRVYYSLYAGGLMKLRITRQFYFTPSIDLFFSQSKRVYDNTLRYSDSYNKLNLGLGSSIGFEYYLSKRISLNTDLLTLSYGFFYDTYQGTQNNSNQSGYLHNHSYFGIYKVMSLGIHYNFNFRKQK